ncbi:predicted protein, partial [Nematostella vectensis]
MPMLSIYNTLTKSKEAFKPLDGNKVRMYVCGMTVYDYCHIGHGRSMVAFDLVTRWLRFSGYDLTYVRNITDIEDKIINRARENGEPFDVLTERMIAAMHEDEARLNILKPDMEPRATDHIPGMLSMIQTLIDKGYAYAPGNGDVYYRVAKFMGYGKLSRKKIEDLRIGARIELYIDDACLSFEPGSFNVLLGRTLSGKTSLMRLMAGLDKPTSGRILMNGADMTQVPVRQRNVSMVYQQFINYPTLTVFENIASPLRQAGVSKALIEEKVHATAQMLRIDGLLKRYPLELSGGQQQRTAMARALVKDASLILFDEPLVNLDYKLREELRQEMRELFQARHTIAIYATTEPNEALALGGTTTILHEGRVVQSGKTAEVYHRPQQVLAAELFSEPAINLMPGRVSGTEVSFADTVHFPLNPDLQGIAEGEYRFGVRPSHIGLVPSNDDDLELAVTVELAEISGSETFLHVRNEQFVL